MLDKRNGKEPSVALMIAMKHRKMKGDEGDKGVESKYRMMAGDILDAIDEKDDAALASALKHFIKACVLSSDKGGDEGEDGNPGKDEGY